MTIKLYGSPLSLYTARVRSYFIKAGVDFEEVPPISDHYEDVVLEKAGGRRGMPTIEFADGEVIRDSVAILDHFEARSGFPFTPTTTKQRLASLVFDLIGAEGLLRPAMHYRWRFAENETMLRHHFAEITPRDPTPEYTLEGRFERLKGAATQLGAPPERIELVERLYLGFLRKLDTHLAEHPYLLGGKPCIGDFGLMGPMHPHLGRDPKPLSLMHSDGVNVLRWVERMNRPSPELFGFEGQAAEYLDDDEVPASLIDVLRHAAIDLVPETCAVARFTNDWLRANPGIAAGTPVVRGLGMTTFEVDGQSMTAMAQPFRLFLLARIQDSLAASSATERSRLEAFLASVDMTPLIDCPIERRIGRNDNLEVWL